MPMTRAQLDQMVTECDRDITRLDKEIDALHYQIQQMIQLRRERKVQREAWLHHPDRSRSAEE